MQLLEYIVLLLLLFLLLLTGLLTREYLKKRALVLALKVLRIQKGDVVLIESDQSTPDEDETAELYRLGYHLQRTHKNIMVVRLPKGYDIRCISPELMGLYGWSRTNSNPPTLN